MFTPILGQGINDMQLIIRHAYATEMLRYVSLIIAMCKDQTSADITVCD